MAGMGAVIIHRVGVGTGCIVSAGAVAIKDLPDSSCRCGSAGSNMSSRD